MNCNCSHSSFLEVTILRFAFSDNIIRFSSIVLFYFIKTLNIFHFQNFKYFRVLNRCCYGDCSAKSKYRCSTCKAVNYCCREHQQKDWTVFHKKNCHPIPALGSLNLISPANILSSTAKDFISTANILPSTAEDLISPAKNPFLGSFDPLVDLHPTSIGHDSVAPNDIWNDDKTNVSICIDLKEVRTDFIPYIKYSRRAFYPPFVLLKIFHAHFRPFNLYSYSP